MEIVVGYDYIKVFDCKSLGDLKKCENLIMERGEYLKFQSKAVCPCNQNI